MNIKAELKKYWWYHSIDLGNGLKTPGNNTLQPIWDFIAGKLGAVHFNGRTVLDIACRDGMFSFIAERRGASKVVGIDNDISHGAIKFLIPFFNSKVEMHEQNVIALKPSDFGQFDVVMMFGVLYHLRFPFLGLRRAIEVVNPGGIILIETAVFCGEPKHLPLLFCPFEEAQPYEPSSVSYFNPKGMMDTMISMGCTLNSFDELEGSDSEPVLSNNVRRCFFSFKKSGAMKPELQRYWEGTHSKPA